jgi:hypothetical protein
MCKKLDVTSNNALRRKTRKYNDDVASRTRSKFGHIHQNVADRRTRSKLQAICNCNKEMFSPLYNPAMLKGQENWKNVDVPLI